MWKDYHPKRLFITENGTPVPADLDARIQQLTSFAAHGQWTQIAPALDSFDAAFPGR